MPGTLSSQVLRVAAIVLLAARPAAAAPQKPAPPSPQAQLEARVKDLEIRLAAAEQKADKATMEKEYILRTQNHYEAYYKEVFSTQTHILWTIGVTVTLIALTFSVVFFVAGRFGFNIFDRRIEAALRDATSQLRIEFGERLANEMNALKEAHAAELKTLEDGLTKRIGKQELHLEARAEYQFQFAQALSFDTNNAWDSAIKHYRFSLGTYKVSKPLGIFDKEGDRPTANIFRAIKARDGEKFADGARKELKLKLYEGLEDELNFAATETTELAPLLEERRNAPSPQVRAESKTEQAKPKVAQPAPPPKDAK
jgi:hypothetical protein